MDKRTALTYIEDDGSWHRASKGAPEQVFLRFSFLSVFFIFFIVAGREEIIFYSKMTLTYFHFSLKTDIESLQLQGRY